MPQLARVHARGVIGMKSTFIWLGVICLLVASIPTVLAQSANTAALTGTVTDPTGAVVANVTVTATNQATNQARTTATGGDGVYRFSLLEPGAYRVRFSVAGFKTAEVSSISL